MQGALVRWLSDIIRLESLTATVDDDLLTVTVRYYISDDQQPVTQVIRQAMGGQ